MHLDTKRGFDFGVNINEIKVPDVLRQRLKFGVDYLDDVFGGNGLTPSQAVMFTGMAGAGKTTMLLIGCNALAKQDCEVIFNTNEENLYQVKLHAERLGLRNGFRLAEEHHLPTLLAKCDELRAKSKKRHFVLVMDSLQTMDDGYFANGATNGRTPERCMEKVVNWTKATNAIAIVIGQVGKGGHFLGTNKLKHMIDTMVSLRIDLRGTPEKNPTFGLRILECTKNRFGGGSLRQYLSIGKRGFQVVVTEGNELQATDDEDGDVEE